MSDILTLYEHLFCLVYGTSSVQESKHIKYTCFNPYMKLKTSCFVYSNTTTFIRSPFKKISIFLSDHLNYQ